MHQNTSNYFKINAGTHHVKVNCDEAKGNFNSNQLMGPARMLVFEAQTQRMYKASCLPYTHWWIEDLENGDVVAGYKPELI